MQKGITFLGENIWNAVTGNDVLLYLANTCISVSVIIVCLLLIRSLFMKRLTRTGMYVLWFVVLLRMVCPFTIHGVYTVLPDGVEEMAARITQGWTVGRTVSRTAGRTVSQTAGQAAGGDASCSNGAVPDGADDGSVSGSRLSDAAEEYVLQSEGEREAASFAGISKSEGGDTGETVLAEATRREDSAVLPETVTNMSGREKTDAASDGPQQMAVWLLILWGAGVSACLCYEVVSMVRTRLRFRDARRLEENVYTHPLLYGSFAAGIFSPRIYIPERLEGAEREYVLRHERVHIRRRDYLWKPLAFTLFSLLWFNPLVWAAYYVMMRDMEISCDERVIRDLPVEERKKYSYLLLSLSGGLPLPSQIPAFCAGEIRERILHVSRYKKPTGLVTAFAAVSVILCSCGVVSTPQVTEPQVTEPPVEVAQRTEYSEQDMLLTDHYKSPFSSKYTPYSNGEFVLNPQGRFVGFRTMHILSDKKGKDLWFEQCIGAEEEYQESDFQDPEFKQPLWEKEYEKRFPDAKYWPERYKYGADGFLYLYVAEYSSNRLTYWYECVEKPNTPFERVKNHLVKIDEATGEMTEIALPEQEKRQVEGSGTSAGAMPGVRRLEFAVSSEGNILLMEEGQNTGAIYDASGQKLSEVKLENRVSDVYSGMGFWAYISKNQATKKMDVNVLDEDGDLLYTMRTEVEDDGSRYLKMALGTKDDEILMVSWEGIYEAKLNEKKFRYVAGHKTDHFLCLWPEYAGLELSNIYKGNRDDYYVGMRQTRDFDDEELLSDYAKQEPWETEEMFHYTKKEE